MQLFVIYNLRKYLFIYYIINMQTTDDFKETKTILKELESLFSREDIQYDIDDINKMRNDIEIQTANVISANHAQIKQCTMEITQKESEIMAPSATAHAESLIAQKENKENMTNQQKTLSQSVSNKKSSIAKLKQQIEQMDTEMAKIRSESELADKKAEYSLSLYNKITNITWNYDNNDTNSVSGYIGNEKAKSYRKFEYSGLENKNTCVGVSDKVWELVDSSSNVV